MRVVSVLPSATEIVCALGHRSDLVGRSAECDYPSQVTELPVVMRARTLDSERSSLEIDARVRRARQRGESLYALDVRLLAQLQPDLLVTQDLCGVCSVTEAEVAEACTRAGVRPRLLSLTPRTLQEVWQTIPTVAKALGDPPAGKTLLATLRNRTRFLAANPVRPRVAVVEWVDPPILAGLWAAEIVEAAGGSYLGPPSGVPGERTTWEEIGNRSPDLVVISPCSFAVPRTQRELSEPRIRASVSRLATRLGVFVADEAYFSRPGPRLADGVRLIHALLQGQLSDAPMPVEPWPTSLGPKAVV